MRAASLCVLHFMHMRLSAGKSACRKAGPSQRRNGRAFAPVPCRFQYCLPAPPRISQSFPQDKHLQYPTELTRHPLAPKPSSPVTLCTTTPSRVPQSRAAPCLSARPRQRASRAQPCPDGIQTISGKRAWCISLNQSRRGRIPAQAAASPHHPPMRHQPSRPWRPASSGRRSSPRPWTACPLTPLSTG